MGYFVLNKDGSTSQNAPLQRFTKEQNAFVNNQWRAFNKSQESINERFGLVDNAQHLRFMDFNQSREIYGNALTVPRDAWGMWAVEGISVQRSVLGVFADLASTNSRGMPIGKLVDYFQRISDSSKDVNTSMDGRGKAKTSQPVLDYQGVPIPIKDNNCSFGWRQMETIMGEPGNNLIQTANGNKLRHMAESLENMALYGEPDIEVAGAKMYGLLNHPQRNSRTTGIVIQSSSPAEIKQEVIATLKLLHAKNFKSGITLYLNWDDYFYMTTYDYQAATANEMAGRQNTRISVERELLNLLGVERIVAADSVPVNTIIALVKDPMVVEILNAMPLVTRPKFRANPEDEYVFMNQTAQAIELKFDAEDQMGLAVSAP